MAKYYVSEKGNKKFPELQVGLEIELVDTGDVYKVLSKGEYFFKPVNGNGLFGFTFGETTSIDPLSREAKGPWEHDGRVSFDADRLPDGVISRICTHKVQGTTTATTYVVVDDRFYDNIKENVGFLTETLDKVYEEVQRSPDYIRAPGEYQAIWMR